MSAAIQVKNLHWKVDDSLILNGIEFSVDEGKVLGIVGPNGAGKTSLLRCLYGRLTPSEGRVIVNGKNIASLSSQTRASHIGVVPQNHTQDVDLSAQDVVSLGLIAKYKPFSRTNKQDQVLIEQALERVGLSSLAQQPLSQLSGGEQQRVFIAKALIQEANILILDEPTNHLDMFFQHEILTLVKQLKLTTIMAIHDLNLAASYCDRMLVMHEGRLVVEGDVANVMKADLLSSVFNVQCHVNNEGGQYSVTYAPWRTCNE